MRRSRLCGHSRDTGDKRGEWTQSQGAMGAILSFLAFTPSEAEAIGGF